MLIKTIKLTQINRAKLLKYGQIDVKFSPNEIAKAIIKENKELIKVPKKYLKQMGEINWVYADFDKGDVVGIIYKRGKYEGTSMSKFDYCHIDNHLKLIKRRGMR